MYHDGEPAEMAMLVFHYSAREAKNLGYRHGFPANAVPDFIDVRAEKAHDYLMKYAESTAPHVIECPPSCEVCGFWATGELDKNGICPECSL